LNRNPDNEPLFSLEHEAWSLITKASSFFLRPKNTDFVNEIGRRARFLFNITPAQRPCNWTRGQILEWLERHPVRDNADIKFFTSEVSRVQDVLIRALELQDFGLATSGGDSGRVGSIPSCNYVFNPGQCEMSLSHQSECTITIEAMNECN
jgi:hypothetical protein